MGAKQSKYGNDCIIVSPNAGEPVISDSKWICICFK